MLNVEVKTPVDADERRLQPLILTYRSENLPKIDQAALASARLDLETTDEIIIPPREARCFNVPKGYFFRIESIDGPQVGDLNLWNAVDLSEYFYSAKTRAFHGTHVGVGHRLWSTLPHLRPLATITHDTLAWYGIDADGAGIHDVCGTRCDPYTNRLLGRPDYHHCCHSNLARALGELKGLSADQVEHHIHDVLNVFMCTGFTRASNQFFMKASPARHGDFLELFAEIDLLCALGTCPGGDCGSTHSSDVAKCYPLKVTILSPKPNALAEWRSPEPNRYGRSHGQAI